MAGQALRYAGQVAGVGHAGGHRFFVGPLARGVPPSQAEPGRGNSRTSRLVGLKGSRAWPEVERVAGQALRRLL
jgi:hypothetical protein